MAETQATYAHSIIGKPMARKGSSPWLTLLMILGIGLLLVMLLLPATRPVRTVSLQTQCMNNLKQIGLALYNYMDRYQAFPPAYTVDASGKPLHSWRTLIAIELGSNNLYDKIDLTKPWDHPANAEAYASMPHPFQCPASVGAPNHTQYLAIVAPSGFIQPTKPHPLSEITDGLQNTMIVIEVPGDQAVHWMSPQDASEEQVSSIGPKSKLAHNGGMNALFCAGNVSFLKADMPTAERLAIISIAGGDNPSEEPAN